MEEKSIMIDQEMDFPVADRVHRVGRPTDARQTIAAIIATTRREWLSQKRASPAATEVALDRPRLAHPLVRYAFDSKRSSSWRARADRQGRIQTVERLADPDCALEGRTPEPV
jgi:hypothetical protein